MKHLGLILVVALIAGQVLAEGINENYGQPILSRGGMSIKIKNFLEKLKIMLREGNPALGLPILDPFVSEDEIPITVNNKLINGTAAVSNFEVIGLSGYNIDKADLAAFTKLTIGLTWPRIYSKGSYKLNVNGLQDINVYGKGDYTVVFTDFSFSTLAKLKISGGLGIKTMETNITLGGLELSATGLYYDESTAKIISKVVSAMAPEILKRHHKEVTDAINEKVIELANELLEGMTISDIQ